MSFGATDGGMIRLLAASLAIAMQAAPAVARDRTVMLTGFDRIRVDGPYDVAVTTGRGASGRISGDDRALDGVSLRVEGRTLIVTAGVNGWGGYPGDPRGAVKVAVTTPMLRAAHVAGGGQLKIDRMRSQRVDLSVSGAGSLAVEAVEADQLDAALNGTGALAVSGTSGRARFLNSGTGSIAAGGLIARDLVVHSQSAGTGSYAARYTADISATGIGPVAVTGSARCTVRGPGPVSCGTAD